MNGAVTELLNHIRAFESGDDRSLACAHRMEGLILEHFTLEEWFDEASLALASYSPAPGEYSLDAAGLIEVLAVVKRSLEDDLPDETSAEGGEGGEE